jgi:hypothetical protein
MSEKLEQSCGGVIFALKEIAAKSSFHNLEKISLSIIRTPVSPRNILKLTCCTTGIYTKNLLLYVLYVLRELQYKLTICIFSWVEHFKKLKTFELRSFLLYSGPEIW